MRIRSVMNEKRAAWWKDNRVFFFLYVAFLAVCFCLILFREKKELHLALNRLHPEALDTIFIYITHLGDGYFAIFISAVLLFYRFRFTLILLLSYGIASGAVQVMKHFFFNDKHRPYELLKGSDSLRLVPGVDVHLLYSFPSGHATTAFVIFTSLAYFTGKPSLKIVFLALAVLAAYSRVYLSQHFLADITAGSVLGISISTLVFLIASGNIVSGKPTWLDKKIRF